MCVCTPTCVSVSGFRSAGALGERPVSQADAVDVRESAHAHRYGPASFQCGRPPLCQRQTEVSERLTILRP